MIDIENDYLDERCFIWWNDEMKRHEVRVINLDNPGIIFHKISGIYLFPEDPFNYQRICKEILEPSADVPSALSYNFIIRRSGRIMRTVPGGFRAKHAGYSRLDGRDYCNSFTFGVAAISTGKALGQEPALTTMQVDALCWLTNFLVRTRRVNPQLLASHEYVRELHNATHPDKKAQSRAGDPGPYFPWNDIRQAALEGVEERD